MAPFLICEFAKSTLSNLIKECYGAEFGDIFCKSQIDYLYHYLADLDAKTILLEPKYTDRDFVEDYVSHYVHCAPQLAPICARLHFFSCEVSHLSLTLLLRGGEKADSTVLTRAQLQEAYLGFSVIKPLPKTPIGKTCLKQYPVKSKAKYQRKCLSRVYDIDLFGIRLQIDTLAFQEQDKEVAACATTAIWAALQAIQWKSAKEIPSCSTITQDALNFIANSHNRFPSRELTNKQIMRALDVAGLRHTNIRVANETLESFSAVVKSCISSQIPLILGVDVYDKQPKSKTVTYLGGHAAAITGWKHGTVYLHDDRHGPFVKAKIVPVKNISPKITVDWGLQLHLRNESGDWEKSHQMLLVNSLIIPMHPEIRLDVTEVRRTCDAIMDGFKSAIYFWPARQQKQFLNSLNFDIRLGEISQIRQHYINHSYRGGSSWQVEQAYQDKVVFLSQHYSRFQWVATFSFEGHAAFDLLFDATALSQGQTISGLFKIDYVLADALLKLFDVFLDGKLEINSERLKMFFRMLKPAGSSYDHYLNQRFGEPRAPKYIKQHELPDSNEDIRQDYFGYSDAVDESLNELFPGKHKIWIWAITLEGRLIIDEDKGHPVLTGFKQARIAGELTKKQGRWLINAKSGRYSGDYPNRDALLQNALNKFKTVFWRCRDDIDIQ